MDLDDVAAGVAEKVRHSELERTADVTITIDTTDLIGWE